MNKDNNQISKANTNKSKINSSYSSQPTGAWYNETFPVALRKHYFCPSFVCFHKHIDISTTIQSIYRVKSWYRRSVCLQHNNIDVCRPRSSHNTTILICVFLCLFLNLTWSSIRISQSSEKNYLYLLSCNRVYVQLSKQLDCTNMHTAPNVLIKWRSTRMDEWVYNAKHKK